jgi:hypothetical protein
MVTQRNSASIKHALSRYPLLKLRPRGMLSLEYKNHTDHPLRENQRRGILNSLVKPFAGFVVLLVSVLYGFNLLQLPSYKEFLLLDLPSEMSRKKCILYHTDWANYARNFQVKDIPIQAVTDIAYAFFNIQDSGGGAWVITAGDE